jgi:hypothetical protein
MRRASHRITGGTRSVMSTRDRGWQRVAHSAQLAGEHLVIVGRRLFALQAPFIALVAGEVGASPGHPVTGNLCLCARISLDKNQQVVTGTTGDNLPGPTGCLPRQDHSHQASECA